MKKISILSFFILSFLSRSQTFNGPGGPIQNNGQDTYFPISISGLTPSQIDSTFGVETICIDITHPAVEELYIYLQSPAGNIVELTEGSSCSGANYSTTCFDSRVAGSITLGSAPFSGTFKPVGYFGRFNTGQTGNGTWNLIVHDGFINTNSGTVNSWTISFGTTPPPPVRFNSSNLPIVILNSSQPILPVKTIINLGIIDNTPNRNHISDPLNDYNQKAAIKIRGSSTRNFEKKSYSLQTEDAAGVQLNTSILGMPSESDWELVAPYQDKSLIRIPLTYDLFRNMGHYAPRYRNVEAVLNGEYQGVYALMEKVKRDSNRVHVNKMTSADNSFPNVSGGYIIKIDRTDAPGWSSLFPGNCPNNKHFFYQYDYPSSSNITPQQQAYIKSYVDSFETVMNSSAYADPISGYSKYIHIGSFIDFFIMNELSRNVDAYRLSTYMYKDRSTHGGKLHIGPVWDYDVAWHNCNYGDAFNASGWQYLVQDTASPSPTWWGRFMQDTSFVNALYCRYSHLRQNILSLTYLNNYIDSSASALNEAQQRNFTQWPILGTYIYPNPQNQTSATYAQEVGDLKTWIANRLAWLDGAILGHCLSAGISEHHFDFSFQLYPNPFESFTTFYLNLNENAQVSLSITDVLGKEVSRLSKRDAAPGELKFVIEKKQIPPGVYFYQVQVNEVIKKGKLIVE